MISRISSGRAFNSLGDWTKLGNSDPKGAALIGNLIESAVVGDYFLNVALFFAHHTLFSVAGLRTIAADTVIFGSGAERLPNTTLFAVPSCKAETALIALDLAGIAASSGSACSSGKVTASHVVTAMGAAPELAAGAVRLSLGRNTTEAEIDAIS